jgi:hypothetical protein
MKTLTKPQKAALAWLAGPGDTRFNVQTRIWNALLILGYVTQRRGSLCVTELGLKALKAR